jgi:hypothetical protein
MATALKKASWVSKNKKWQYKSSNNVTREHAQIVNRIVTNNYTSL